MRSQSNSDPFLFYACTASSFLESRVDTYVDNLGPFFQCDSATKSWLENVWMLEEQEHGRLMRAYVEGTWPEFDWDKGFKAFSDVYIPQCETEKLRHSVGLEALSRCVIETHTAMIYRCIASYSDDPALQTLLKRISADEVRHFRKFKELHKKYELEEKNGFLRKAKTLLNRNALVRDEDIALAFHSLNDCWVGQPPFKPWSYEEFLKQTAQVMREHFPFEEAKRMFFNPLKTENRLENWLIEIMAKIVAWQFMRYA